MKHYNLLIVAALVGLSLSSCAQKESVDTTPVQRSIRFTSNLSAYATRATDTDFEAGDEVSLFTYSDDTVVEDNVKMTFSDGELVPEHDIYWDEKQADSVCTNFYAIYPYREDWELWADLAVSSVNADQSTRELYAASDLLAASYMTYPDCETVPLNFTHRLSKFSVNVHVADSISRVYLSGVYGKFRLRVNNAMEVWTVGEKGDVSMYADGEGDDMWTRWSAIIPPQSMDFKVVVEKMDGRQYAFAPSSKNDVANLQPAYWYSADVYCNHASEADYYVQVRDWTADNDAQFGEYVSDRYHTEGNWYLRTGGEDIGLFGGNILTNWFGSTLITPDPSATYDLVYRIASHEYVYGLPEEGAVVTPCDTLSLVEGGKPFRINETSECMLSVDPYSNSLRVATYDENVYLAIRGGERHEMTRIGTLRYTVDFDYWGEEFCFTGSSGWVLASSGGILYHGVWQLYRNNAVFFTLTVPGKYRMTVDLGSLRLKIEYMGTYTPEAYNAMLGDWSYTKDDGSAYDISIKSSAYDFIVSIAGHEFHASYDNARSRMVIPFQKVGDWYWETYSGNAENWLCAGLSDGQLTLGGDGEDLMYCTVSEDGSSINVAPAFSNIVSYYMLALLVDGPYAGRYGYYFDDMTLPQVWSKK